MVLLQSACTFFEDRETRPGVKEDARRRAPSCSASPGSWPAAALASADTFRFAYTKGEKYRIVSQISESVYVNGRFSHESDILDRIAVTVTDTKGDAGYHEVTYQTSERAYGSDSDLRVERGVHLASSGATAGEPTPSIRPTSCPWCGTSRSSPKATSSRETRGSPAAARCTTSGPISAFRSPSSSPSPWNTPTPGTGDPRRGGLRGFHDRLRDLPYRGRRRPRGTHVSHPRGRVFAPEVLVGHCGQEAAVRRGELRFRLHASTPATRWSTRAIRRASSSPPRPWTRRRSRGRSRSSSMRRTSPASPWRRAIGGDHHPGERELSAQLRHPPARGAGQAAPHRRQILEAVSRPGHRRHAASPHARRGYTERTTRRFRSSGRVPRPNSSSPSGRARRRRSRCAAWAPARPSATTPTKRDGGRTAGWRSRSSRTEAEQPVPALTPHVESLTFPVTYVPCAARRRRSEHLSMKRTSSPNGFERRRSP